MISASRARALSMTFDYHPGIPTFMHEVCNRLHTDVIEAAKEGKQSCQKNVEVPREFRDVDVNYATESLSVKFSSILGYNAYITPVKREDGSHYLMIALHW